MKPNVEIHDAEGESMGYFHFNGIEYYEALNSLDIVPVTVMLTTDQVKQFGYSVRELHPEEDVTVYVWEDRLF